MALGLSLLLLLANAGPRSEVRLEGGRVIVRATGAPLTEVLSRFSKATGTKIVYETARPRQRVSVDIDAASEAEALAQLLEGRELGYAVRLDKSGKRVEMLVVTGKGGEIAPAVPAAAEPEMAPEPPPEIDTALPDQEAVTPAEEAAPPSSGPPPGGDAGVPPILPTSGTSPGTGATAQTPVPAPVVVPSAPSLPSYSSYPVPPVPASYPTPQH